MRNKKIEILEKRIADLEDSNHKLGDTLDFITKYGKDEIAIELGCDTINLPYTNSIYNWHIVVKYLYTGKVMQVKSNLSTTIVISIVDNCKHQAVLEQDGQYYSLDKLNGTINQIPKPAFVLEKELAEKKATAKKAVDSKKKS